MGQIIGYCFGGAIIFMIISSIVINVHKIMKDKRKKRLVEKQSVKK